MGQVAPLSDLEIVQLDVHDPYSFQLAYLIAECLAHPSDLAVESLGEDDLEDTVADFGYSARLGDSSENADATGHALQKWRGDRLVDGDDVLFFVIVFCPQYFIDDISIVRQQNQPLRVLVQATDRENALRMIHKINDVPFDMQLGRAGDADGLVQGDVDRSFLGADGLSIDADIVTWFDCTSQLSQFAIDRHPSGFDQLV